MRCEFLQVPGGQRLLHTLSCQFDVSHGLHFGPCRDSVLGADRVSNRAEEGAKGRHHPVVRLGCT